MAVGYPYLLQSTVSYLNKNFHSLSELSRHWFRHYGSLKIWGNTKILLLDTTFWPQLSSNPEKFTEKWRSKIDMVNYDYVVMPMFEV
jgi:hypothetical protein